MKAVGPVLLVAVGVACAPDLAWRAQVATVTPCPEVLAEYDGLRRSSGYAEQPVQRRLAYEEVVVACHMRAKSYPRVRDMISSWPPAHRWAAELRVSSGERDDEGCRVAMQGFRAARGDPRLLTRHGDLKWVAAQRWFVEQTLLAWGKSPDDDLHEFVSSLADLGGHELLDFRVAAADASRPAGSLVLWTGLVQDARIDRGRNRTVLLAEGVEIEQVHVGRDRAVGRRGAWSRPKEYRVTDFYREQLRRGGRQFLVEVQSLDEGFLKLDVIFVAGYYSGSDTDSGARRAIPKVEALVVQPRILNDFEEESVEPIR